MIAMATLMAVAFLSCIAALFVLRSHAIAFWIADGVMAVGVVCMFIASSRGFLDAVWSAVGALFIGPVAVTAPVLRSKLAHDRMWVRLVGAPIAYAIGAALWLSIGISLHGIAP